MVRKVTAGLKKLNNSLPLVVVPPSSFFFLMLLTKYSFVLNFCCVFVQSLSLVSCSVWRPSWTQIFWIYLNCSYTGSVYYCRTKFIAYRNRNLWSTNRLVMAPNNSRGIQAFILLGCGATSQAIDARRFETITPSWNLGCHSPSDSAPYPLGTENPTASLLRPKNSLNSGIVHRAAVGTCIIWLRYHL